jgi:hypothetical protein
MPWWHPRSQAVDAKASQLLAMTPMRSSTRTCSTASIACIESQWMLRQPSTPRTQSPWMLRHPRTLTVMDKGPWMLRQPSTWTVEVKASQLPTSSLWRTTTRPLWTQDPRERQQSEMHQPSATLSSLRTSLDRSQTTTSGTQCSQASSPIRSQARAHRPSSIQDPKSLKLLHPRLT